MAKKPVKKADSISIEIEMPKPEPKKESGDVSLDYQNHPKFNKFSKQESK